MPGKCQLGSNLTTNTNLLFNLFSLLSVFLEGALRKNSSKKAHVQFMNLTYGPFRTKAPLYILPSNIGEHLRKGGYRYEMGEKTYKKNKYFNL